MVNLKLILVAIFVASFLASAVVYGGQKKGKAPAPKEKPAEVAKVSANYGKYDFTVTTLDGKTVHLADYAGKVVLVTIWAPWCGPCRLETPGFVKMYEQYKPKGFEILGVAVQTNETDVRSFINQQKVSWPIGINDDVMTKYGTYGLPDNFLFKPDGSVIKHFIGYTKEESLQPLIESALKEVAANTAKKTSAN